MKTLILLLSLYVPFITGGQTVPDPVMPLDDYNDFGFMKDFSVPVFDIYGTLYVQPWVGGMNSCQFSEIDLNDDGVKDLFVFDRHGNRIMPFINHGTKGIPDYSYAPEFIIKFPYLHDWVNLVDYDCDGREDIFTYTIGGIRIYRNISETGTGLKFELVAPILYSYYYTGYVNLFALVDDYPVFSDIDLDGDIDILNFWTLGKYVNYHKNLSIEKYGTCDSLDYILTEDCWGYFSESESSNVLTLNITCGQDGSRSAQPDQNRHSGSTLLALDLNGDNVKDIVIGDVDYSNLISLINGGTVDSAHMISQDTLFPQGHPVELMSMPSAQYLDLDNDGVKDLVVSPFDPSYDRSQNDHSIWYYKNNGTNGHPHFDFQQDDFLQDEMIDVGGGAYPVVCDVDKDGLNDLLVGNFGYLDSTWHDHGFLYFRYRSQIAFFRNTGTAGAPEYRLVDNDFGHLSSLKILGAYPAMADIDGDGDADMLVGNADGTLYYLLNVAGPGEIPIFTAAQADYQNIDVGDYSTPQLVDLNRDSYVDLVIGESNGNLHYYANTGTHQNPQFSLITDYLGGVDVTNPNLSLFGYSVPCFFEVNGEYRLFVGSEFGDIFYYKDIDGHLDGTFTLSDPHLLYISEGYRTGVTILNYNGDQYPDMIIGNWAGGLALYKGVTPGPAGIGTDVKEPLPVMNLRPNPAGGTVRVSFKGCYDTKNIDLHICDVFGRDMNVTVLSRDNNEIKLDISAMKPGVYLVYPVINGFKGKGERMVVK